MYAKLLKQLPTPICGLALGLAALSNLLFTINLTYLPFLLFYISLIIIVIFLQKLLLFPHTVANELKNANTCATFPALPMALLSLLYILHHYLHVIGWFITIMWWLMVLIHFSILLGFIIYHIWLFPSTDSKPNTSWFVAFVGIGVIAETSEGFSTQLGAGVVYLGSIFFIILLLFVLCRKAWQRYNNQQFPMAVIISAPAALCLNGYLLTRTDYSMLYIGSFFVLSQALFIMSLFFIPRIKTIGFQPAYAALTFPWVTTATSVVSLCQLVNLPPLWNVLLNIVMITELIFATLVVVYVTLTYIKYIINHLRYT